MIRIYKEEELNIIREAGAIVRKCHEEYAKMVQPGITTKDIDDKAIELFKEFGVTSATKGYMGYPLNVCISVNNCVVHGTDLNITLKEGDNVSIDIVIDHNGYKADRGWTYPVGQINKKHARLLKDTEKALYLGIEQVKPGNRIGHISDAIGSFGKKNKYGIVEELAGHGVGATMHEDPMIPNYGPKNAGEVIEAGMVFAIEPMFNMKSKHIFVDEVDEWSVYTMDGKKAAHFEHTVIVTKDGYEIVT